MTAQTLTGWERPVPLHVGRVGGQVLKAVLPAAVAVGALAVLLPRSIGTTWSGIGAELAVVQVLWLPAALAVWLLGLWVQTAVQTASLPGLTSRRALLLNATGSAVSNIAPMGGALGMETNRRMVRGWGFTHSCFVGYVTLTNVVALFSKLVLPILALAWALAVGVPTGPLSSLAVVSGLTLFGLVGALSIERAAQVGDRLLGALADGVRRMLRRPGAPLRPWLSESRSECAGLVSQGWRTLVSATVGYHLLQGLLLWIALHAVGVAPTAVAVAAALAVERAATLLVVLPAGLGVAEVAAAATLVGLGLPAPAAAAGLLLHRLFVVVLEVPLGLGLGGFWWMTRGRHTPRLQPAHSAFETVSNP